MGMNDFEVSNFMEKLRTIRKGVSDVSDGHHPDWEFQQLCKKAIPVLDVAYVILESISDLEDGLQDLQQVVENKKSTIG